MLLTARYFPSSNSCYNKVPVVVVVVVVVIVVVVDSCQIAMFTQNVVFVIF